MVCKAIGPKVLEIENKKGVKEWVIKIRREENKNGRKYGNCPAQW
jgi:hypothetical protein